MEVLSLSLPGLKLIKPRLFSDERGYFFESFHERRYREAGIEGPFVQDNASSSRRGTVRGLHYQKGQAKLVSVTHGKIWDVVVDIREGSPTFGRWEAVELDGESHLQLFIPDGFAHGFCALSEGARLHYKTSAFYDPARDRAIRWNDPELNIQWPVSSPLLSPRDAQAPLLQERV